MAGPPSQPDPAAVYFQFSAPESMFVSLKGATVEKNRTLALIPDQRLLPEKGGRQWNGESLPGLALLTPVQEVLYPSSTQDFWGLTLCLGWGLRTARLHFALGSAAGIGSSTILAWPYLNFI